MKKQAINHIAIQPEPLEEPPSPDMSSVTYYVRDANEAVMAMYHQTAHHASGPLGCLRKPNNGGVDMEMDGLVDNPWNCDNCRVGMLGGLPGGEWNPWQEDYDGDGVGDACDPCPYKGTLGDPCGGPEKFPQAEVWSGTAVVTTLAELPIYGSERLGLMRPNVNRDTNLYTGATFTRRVDQKEYELKDHLGNVRVVVSDMKTRVTGTNFTLIVKSVNNYYAFGMLQEGMSGSSGDYRYGYNGKEMDNEMKGTGNSLNYGARMYDPRLGRWGSIDPFFYKYSDCSPYNYVLNMPTRAVDPDGRLVIFVNGYRIFNQWSQAEKNEKKGTQTVYTQDKFGYWGDMDLEFMKRLQDFNAVYFDADNFRGSTAAQRYFQGVLAGYALVEKIKKGEVVLQKGESIKIIAHSQGCAYAAGLVSVFDPGLANSVVGQLEEIPKIEVVYNLAPKQPKNFQFPSYVERVVQYSHKYDWIAPQDPIKGVHEYIPIDRYKFNPIVGHMLKSYWKIFDRKSDYSGYVAPRKDKPKPSNPLNPPRVDEIKPGHEKTTK